MTLALIAGTGGLPSHVAASLLAEGRVPTVCEMRGFPSEVTGEFTRVPFRIETLGTFLETLKSLGVTDICMAGAMQRPSVDPSAIDALTLPMVPRLMQAMAKGDDGTLREVIAIFEEHGFGVVGAHQIAPDLLPIAGVHTQVAPPDLTLGLAAAKSAFADMGQADLGQAMIVRDAEVIAREDKRGTAAMLQDLHSPLGDPSEQGDLLSDTLGVFGDAIGGVADWLSGTDGDVPLKGAGGVLFKGPKPTQNLLVDMPVIGPDTAMQAAEAGLSGIVIAAGGVMVLDAAQVVAILNAQGMFLWVAPDLTPESAP